MNRITEPSGAGQGRGDPVRARDQASTPSRPSCPGARLPAPLSEPRTPWRGSTSACATIRLRRAGPSERAHFADACAALWLEGDLVHLEDLVLRDAGMDVRMAADGTNRAMSVLRARRLVARRGGAWALSSVGLDALRGRRTGSDHPVTSPRERSDLVYDRDWDEEERLAEWQDVVKKTDKLPALVAAAIAFDAWCRLAPLQHAGWIGSLLVSALLQTRGKTRHHVASLNVGMRAASYRRAHVQDLGTRCGGNIPERPQAVGWLPRIPIVLARERDVLPAERRDVGEQFVEDN